MIYESLGEARRSSPSQTVTPTRAFKHASEKRGAGRRRCGRSLLEDVAAAAAAAAEFLTVAISRTPK